MLSQWFSEGEGLNWMPVVGNLVECAVRATPLLLLALLVTWVLRRTGSAGARHWVWGTAILGVLVTPWLSPLLPGWHVLPSQSAHATPDVVNEPTPVVGVEQLR